MRLKPRGPRGSRFARWRRFIAGALFLCAASVLGWTIHLQWFEWIERPRLWREVMMGILSHYSVFGGDGSMGGSLNPAAEEKFRTLLLRQIPQTSVAPWRDVFLQRIPLIGPRQAWVASGNVDFGVGGTWIQAAVFDQVGRVIPGAPEPVPFSWEVHDEATRPGFVGFRSIAAGDGCAAFFEVGPERLSPRGLHLLLKPNLAVPVSWRVSRSAWGWLAGSESSLAAPERIARELEASSPQVILSALADLELHGPELAVLAVPVLGSSSIEEAEIRNLLESLLWRESPPSAALLQALDDLLRPAATGTIDADLAASVLLVRTRWSEPTDRDQLDALTDWLAKHQEASSAVEDSQSVSTRARELLRALNLVLRAPREDRLGLIEVLWSHLWRSPWMRSD